MNSTKQISEISALYSDLDWQYSQAMSGPYIDYRDKTEDGETIAGLKDGRISGAWRPMVCVGTSKWQKSEIKRLWDISHDIYYMDFLIDGQLSEVSKFLLRQGYRARPVYTQIINLTKSQEELHADLRKSYKSLINERIKHIKFSILITDLYALHKRKKGETRDIKTWQIQQKMIDMGEALLAVDAEGSKLYAASLFYLNKHNIYYASSSSIEGHHTHALIWQTITKIKDVGQPMLELGEQVYHPGQIMMDGKSATKKHCNISLFKRGFSGKTVTRLILEK